MRVAKLCLLGVVAYVLAMLVFFPVSFITNKIEPQIKPFVLSGVQGKVFGGSIASVDSTDDLLPLSFQNVRWSVAPTSIVTGGGADIEFEGYGGGGKGFVKHSWGGDVSVSDASFTAKAPEFDSFTMPFASLAGDLSGTIDTLQLENQLLKKLVANIVWKNAAFTLPFAIDLGDVELDVQPEANDTHIATVKARGGEVTAEGKVTLSANGDFNADIVLTPTDSASRTVLGGLRQIAKRDSQGRYRLQRRGNINRL